MDNRMALDPKRSVVVEACAGSGKTWLLVSRIIRLLLDGTKPSEILAITFTRKAAQEMQSRLRDWLFELASKEEDAHVCDFLQQRGIADADMGGMLKRARLLYQQFLLAEPSITISTFHGWFMQILQRVPMSGGFQLAEENSELMREAWETFLDGLHEDREGETSKSMMYLFGNFGIFNAQKLLQGFVEKRAEWWTYSRGRDAYWACEELQREFAVSDPEFDPFEDWGMCGNSEERLFAFTIQLALNGTDKQKESASEIEMAWTETEPERRFEKIWLLLFTEKGSPRSLKPTKKQNEDAYLHTRDALQSSLLSAKEEMNRIEAVKMNRAALLCGTALLETYQSLKLRQQLLDFTDLEWRVHQLLGESDHAEYMQYKLDSRYRHVLLDEFQDTNPFQWQILQSWFAASTAADTKPRVFVVGDPKQSIYRFRRADARLFDVAREYLEKNFDAVHLKKNETRRNAPAVLELVNAIFEGMEEYQGFERHEAHRKDLAGCVEVMPLEPGAGDARLKVEEGTIKLRNPLFEAYPEKEEGARDMEASMFAQKVKEIVGGWQVETRAATYSDIMVLVRKRTHLVAYEKALRELAIPYLTSRRGGLLDTLEASDIQALLNFLVTPFDDLALAHALCTPIFSCSDEDLMRIRESVIGNQESGIGIQIAAGETELHSPSFILNPESWWSRLRMLAENGDASPEILRAARLLQGWMLLADRLPVHDLLDRIFFEGDARVRYANASPESMRAAVLANLQAFLEIALSVDAGRYPSLPGFLRELAELRRADENDSPDEGRVAEAGNAIRIYTVHEAKGLEAPIVWLLDANAASPSDKGYGVLLDWPTGKESPAHFSLYADKESRGAFRAEYFEKEERIARRENLNLLYVAMTRAKQYLIASGNGKLIEGSWYDLISKARRTESQPVLVQDRAAQTLPLETKQRQIDERLLHPVPTGRRKARLTEEQRYGIMLHSLMQHLKSGEDGSSLQRRLNIDPSLMPELLRGAKAILDAPELSRFFDENCYVSAANEVEYVNASGELKRMDRLVEFESEVWVLDYKTGLEIADHTEQLEEYRAAMQAVYPGKKVRCALIYSGGKFAET